MFQWCVCALCVLCGQAFAADYARVEGARFRSVLPAAPPDDTAAVAPFLLARRPVTNGEFLAFVRAHPQWRRDRIARLFADEGYLRHWAEAGALGTADPQQPVTQVSWFAAVAYCEAQGARLPTWHEWEWAAAADERSTDARDDPAWRQRILSWYSRPATDDLRRVAAGAPDVRGVHDLHGLIWEWVEDFGSLLVGGDSRESGDPDRMKFCGSGALDLEQKENYAVLMRIALLSSLQARSTMRHLGFRCARPAPGAP
ncbi:MAG: formylglycine-generating enzyme family protein [Gammaproteobacteria bacterium]|nr:formylglycine-generating enzyme family protein [Gammaproteobacteria bacterium]